MAQKWRWCYNVERPYLGDGEEDLHGGLREPGLDLPDGLAAFPVVLPDGVAVI